MEIPSEMLRRLLEYDPQTGRLTWKVRDETHFVSSPKRTAKHKAANWNSLYAGREALTNINANGYRRGSILGKPVLAHRAILAIVTGEWPRIVDHQNGDRLDNRLANLRGVTPGDSQKNLSVRCDSRTGVMGVEMTPSGRYRASIKSNGKKLHLGCFEDLRSAEDVRRSAQVALGFHQNHGRENPARSMANG